MYVSERGGGGGGSVEEAIKRGKAYAEAGADSVTFPICPPDALQTIIAEVPIPVSVIGMRQPNVAFTMSTAWGWTGAAQLHLARARELMETGSVTMDFNFPEKYDLIEHPLFDGLIEEWAEKTGRKSRPNHAA